MNRSLLCFFLCAAPLAAAPAVTQSVEFPWATFPRALWERELVWLKNIGIGHVSLPPAPAGEAAGLVEAIHIIRLLNLEADLEGPVPAELQPQTRAHGGPLTDGPAVTPAGGAARISALASDALLRGRRLLASAAPMILWSDVEDTIGPSGFRAGAVGFGGTETPATTALRRNAQLFRYWGTILASIRPRAGAALRLPAPGISVQLFMAESGASFVQAVNNTGKAWTGDLRVAHPVLKRVIVLTSVTLPPHDSLWLPVDVPLAAGPLCRDCTAFATVDRLIWASAEITDIEYENGILAMEFSAPAAGSVVLGFSREPSGPLVAGGKPVSFEWDDTTKHARLPIPAGKGPGNRVRIGLAMEAPDATGFFDSARVLLIGENNDLTAQFSSDAIMQRSRLLAAPELHITQVAGPEPLKSVYRIAVPANTIHGDRTELALEADGARMSHANPEYLRPVQLRFTDALAVQVGAHSALALSPAAVPVNQRGGRDVSVSVRNNAPEIRGFHVELKAEGLEFSPEKLDVTIGASAVRDVSFRVFATAASSGVHNGEVRVTGAAAGGESVRFVVIPQAGSVTWNADGFTFIESTKTRASFMPGRWLEFVDKDNGQSALAAGGVPFNTGGLESLRLDALEAQLPKAKR